MKFRTEIFPEKSGLQITPKSRVATFGSCFADNIARKFDGYKFNILQNPFGVLYNPVSIANAIKIIIDKKRFSEKDLIFYKGEYHSLYHHSSFSSQDADEIIRRINSAANSAYNFLSEANLLVITFGTAWVYEYNKTKEVVSNCHKIPASEFTRRKLDIRETAAAAARGIKLLRMINPGIKVLLTVSPVRHWKDGAVENQRSKATLLLAVEKLVAECESLFYFPSYEILMDDLRDYRFYEKDLVHPNDAAVDYIWEKFSETYFSGSTMNYLSEIKNLQKALNHKLRNRKSDEAKIFIDATVNKINKFVEKYPHADFSREMKKLLSNENLSK